MSLLIVILFQLIAFSPAQGDKGKPITIKVTRPIGVEASSYVRYVQGGGLLNKSAPKDGTILIMGSVLSVKYGKLIDHAVLATGKSPDHLKAAVHHDDRLKMGKIASIACRATMEIGDSVTVSDCQFLVAE